MTWLLGHRLHGITGENLAFEMIVMYKWMIPFSAY